MKKRGILTSWLRNVHVYSGLIWKTSVLVKVVVLAIALISMPVHYGFAACKVSRSVFALSQSYYQCNNEGNLAEVSYTQSRVRNYKAIVMENDLISIKVVPQLGGRIISLKDKETGRELLFIPEKGIPYGIGKPYFYYQWLMLPGGIFSSIAEAEHGKAWLLPWDYKVVKNSSQEVAMQLTFFDTINIPRTGDLVYGKTFLIYTVTISLYEGKKYVEYKVKVNNPGNTTQRYEVWTGVTLPDRNFSNPNSQGVHIVLPVERITTKDAWWPWLKEAEEVIDPNLHLYRWNNLAATMNWIGYGIANPLVEDNPMWWAMVDYQTQSGLLCLRGNDNLKKGIKLWSWGYNNETKGGYPPAMCEIWNGVSEEFKIPTTIGPGMSQEWKLYYYPLAESIPAETNILLPDKKILKYEGIPDRLSYYRQTPWTFDKLIDKDLHEPGYPRRKISLYYQGGYYKECKALIQKSLTEYPQFADQAYPIMIGCLLMEEKFAEAQKYFVETMGITDPAQYLKNMVDYYDASDQTEKIMKLDQYIIANHDHKFRHYICDYYTRHVVNVSIREDIIKEIASAPELRPYYEFYRGKVYFEKGRYDYSRRLLKHACTIMPDKSVKLRICDSLVYSNRKLGYLVDAIAALKEKLLLTTKESLTATERVVIDKYKATILLEILYLTHLTKEPVIPVLRERLPAHITQSVIMNPEEKAFWLRYCDSRFNFEEAEKFQSKDPGFWSGVRKIIENL